jgi:hypothetical protein
MENEVLVEKNSVDTVPIKLLHLINIPNDSEQKVAATPSFGAGNRKFVFDTKEKELLYIN